MYLEILSNTIVNYLKENKPLLNFGIVLTHHIYNEVIRELNEVISFKTEIPIQGVIVSSITIHEKVVKLSEGDKLDVKFELELISTLNKRTTP